MHVLLIQRFKDMMNETYNLKLAIIDFEDELKLQHAQFELFRRVWGNTAKLPDR